MKRIVFPFFLFFMLFSCKDNKEVQQEKTTDTVDTTVVEKVTPVDESVSEDADFKNDFDILLATSYRTWENKNPAASLTKSWTDLYEKNGKFYLGKADFKLESGYDECAGDSTKIINSNTKTLLFMDLPELKSGEIKSLKIDKNKIWPKEKVTFVFNGVEYFLRAEGEVLASEKVINDGGKEEIFQNVKNYKLYISTKNTPEKLLLQEVMCIRDRARGERQMFPRQTINIFMGIMLSVSYQNPGFRKFLNSYKDNFLLISSTNFLNCLSVETRLSTVLQA